MTLNIPNTIVANNIQSNLCKQLNSMEIEWLNESITLLLESQDKINDLLDLSAVVKRTFTSPVQLSHSLLITATNAEVIRILLIKIALHGSVQSGQGVLLKQYYRGADASEKMAWLKGLIYVDEQGVALNTAISASRCNSVDEFTALALNNDYVVQHFPELNFNQLVLKALFMGLDISRINMLSSRLNAKLSNMCVSFAIEQALANRIPPASLWQAVKPDDLHTENSLLLTQYLNHFYQQNDNHKEVLTWFIEHYQLKIIIRE
jgi:hypothetical protein